MLQIDLQDLIFFSALRGDRRRCDEAENSRDLRIKTELLLYNVTGSTFTPRTRSTCPQSQELIRDCERFWNMTLVKSNGQGCLQHWSWLPILNKFCIQTKLRKCAKTKLQQTAQVQGNFKHILVFFNTLNTSARCLVMTSDRKSPRDKQHNKWIRRRSGFWEETKETVA